MNNKNNNLINTNPRILFNKYILICQGPNDALFYEQFLRIYNKDSEYTIISMSDKYDSWKPIVTSLNIHHKVIYDINKIYKNNLTKHKIPYSKELKEFLDSKKINFKHNNQYIDVDMFRENKDYVDKILDNSLSYYSIENDQFDYKQVIERSGKQLYILQNEIKDLDGFGIQIGLIKNKNEWHQVSQIDVYEKILHNINNPIFDGLKMLFEIN